ncbi:T-complex protein 11-like protein 2 [Clytia hemisphaerica]|uniref:Uncharacterized protein n=1 Tax=Clytia hemisphaerica TaxID=252671 RepID=A0A7M6DQN7_9CNID
MSATEQISGNIESIVANMALAHEMIMNDDFQLTALNEASENSSLEKRIHDVLHKAFWDVLEEEVKSEPPEFKNAFNLLMEMKMLILEIIPKSKAASAMRTEIEETLDEELIKQQIDHNAFDIVSCASFILSTLSKICAPVRDARIKALKAKTDLVPLLRGTFELINLMKIDIANYEIKSIKPILMKQAVKYEDEKFNEFLKENKDGLNLTKIWLKNALDIINSIRSPSSQNKVTPGVVITNAYLSLLFPTSELCPETLFMDELRLKQISGQFEVLINTVSSLTYCLHFLPPHLSTDEDFIIHLKKTIFILIQGSKWDETLVESIFLQIQTETEKECSKREIELKTPAQWDILRNQLKGLLTNDKQEPNQLKTLIKSRIRDYVLLSMTSQTLQTPMFTVLAPIQNELKELSTRFVRVVNHNKQVHCARYMDIVEELLGIKSDDDSDSESEKEIGENSTDKTE